MFDPNDNDNFDPKIQLVRPYVQMHYTITPIGGKAEYEQWKLSEAKREEELQVKKAKNESIRRTKAISMVQEQNSVVKFTKEEQREVDRTIALNMAKDKLTRSHSIKTPLQIQSEAIHKILELRLNRNLKPTLSSKVKAWIYNAFFPKQ